MRKPFRLVALIAFIGTACNDVPIVPATPSAWEVTGNDQTGVPGYRLPNVITVRVIGDDGRPIRGDTVDIVASDHFASIELPAAKDDIYTHLTPTQRVVTDSTGSFSVFWRLGATLGKQMLRVSSRIPGVGSFTVAATSRSRPLVSIDGGDFGMCAVDTLGQLGCWLPPRLSTQSIAGAFHPAATGNKFSEVALSYANTAVKGCAVALDGGLWCFSLDSAANILGFAQVSGAFPPLAHIFGGGLSSGNYCALDTTGAAWCWGSDNGAGQLGDGTVLAHAIPAPVASAARFASMDMTFGHTCGLTALGEAWCWGGNRTGESGVSPFSIAVTTPTAVITALRFQRVRVISASESSCGFAADGGMYCWGNLEELGFAATTTASLVGITATPALVSGYPSPIDLAEMSGGDGGFGTIVFDHSASLRYTGAFQGDGTRLFYRPAQQPGVLTDITLRHGVGYVCGTAALSGVTLCPALGFNNVIDVTPPFRRVPIVGVPFP